MTQFFPSSPCFPVSFKHFGSINNQPSLLKRRAITGSKPKISENTRNLSI